MTKRHPTNAEEVVAILREVGLRRLMGPTGCHCGWVQIRGYHIDRSCHRSDRSLRVYLQGDMCGDTDEDLKLVTAEAERQMREEDDWSEFTVHNQEWRRSP